MGDLGLFGETTVLDDGEAVASALADWVTARSAAAISASGRFLVALEGGSTPRRMYQLLATRDDIDWPNWHVFWGDERACPPDDPESNYAMAEEFLLRHVDIPASNVHRMPADDEDLAIAARQYSDLLARVAGNDSPTPELDCILLGLGTNGHTASLFPGDASLDVTEEWCTVGHADYAPFDRLTLTFPCINAARHVAFAVTGAPKHDALLNVAAGTVPAARVRPNDLHWFLDQNAQRG